MMNDSKRQILDLLKRKGILTVDSVKEQVGLAKTTVREHFLQLERDGLIDREFLRSGPGRPRLQYRLTQKGEALFPSQEASMLRQLIHFLKENGKEVDVESFFAQFWERRYQRAAYLMEGEADRESKLDKLNEMLREEGFMPEVNSDSKEGTLSIKECNCPFSEVVKETKLPCKLEALFYERLFEIQIKRTSYIGDGDHSCTYEIPVNT